MKHQQFQDALLFYKAPMYLIDPLETTLLF